MRQVVPVLPGDAVSKDIEPPLQADVKMTVRRLLSNLWGNKGIGWRAVRMLLMLVLGLAAFVMVFEDRFIYYPEKYASGFRDVSNISAREGQIVPETEDCYFSTTDGVRLHGWYCRPRQRSGENFTRVPTGMVLLWFHGNAGNISHRGEMIAALMPLPVEVFIIDYRGYGRSEGSPSERGLYIDATAAWDFLTNERGIQPRNIIIFGKSLGGAPAIDLATRVQSAGLIVQSAFTSIPDMARSVIPFFPGVLLRTKMDSINKIGQVQCPKLFIHSPGDEVVPYRMGRRLYEAAADPKQFYEVPSSPHNETWMVGGKAYLDTLRSFIGDCAAWNAQAQVRCR